MDLVWTNNFTALSNLCGNTGAALVTFTVTDNCGQASTTTATFTIEDTTPPVLLSVPADATVECNAVPAPATVTATDACGSASVALVVTTTQTSNGSCTDNTYTLTRTWTATDECGLKSTATQVITVQDTTVPVFGANATVCRTFYPVSTELGKKIGPDLSTVSSKINVPVTGTVVSVKLTSLDIQHTFDADMQIFLTAPNGDILELSSDNGSSGDNYTVTTFSDDAAAFITTGTAPFNGSFKPEGRVNAIPSLLLNTVVPNTGTLGTFKFSTQFNNDPAFGDWLLTIRDVFNGDSGILRNWGLEMCIQQPLPTTMTVQCNALPTIAPAATDNCDNSVAITTAADVITAGSCPNNYTITRVFTATDNCNNSTQHTVTIQVEDTTPPVFTSALPANVTVACSAVPVAAVLTAADNCGAATVAMVETGANGTGCYTLVRTWTATDLCGNMTTHTQTITVQDLVAPVLDFGITPVVTTYSSTTTPKPVPATGTGAAPSGTYPASALPPNCPAATVDTINITDNYAISDLNVRMRISHTFRGDLDVVLRAPDGTLVGLFNDIGSSGDNFGTTCPPNFGLDDQASLTANATNIFSTTGGATGGGVTGLWRPIGPALSILNGKNIQGAWTLYICDDASGGSGTLNCWSIEATRSNPSSTITASCNAIPAPLTPTATDNCDASPVLAMTQTSTQTTTGACTDNTYVITRTYSATDNCNNTSYFTQTINVQDIVAPTWTTAAGALNTTVQCSDAAAMAAAQAMFPAASDLCDPTVDNIVKTSGAFVPGACPQAGTITNTWTVTDACGNTSAPYTQVITVIDTQVPTWVTPAGSLNVTLDCGNSAGLADAQAMFPMAMDNCDMAVTNIVKTAGVFAAGTCPNAGTYTNTWRVTDDCGNISTMFTQVITITDMTAPVINDPASNVTVQCNGTGNGAVLSAWLTSQGGATASDACGAITWSNNFTSLSDLCGATGSAIVTFTATDACGNASSITATFSIIDTTVPVISPAATNMTVECDGAGNASALAAWIANHGGASATDVCGSVTWSTNPASPTLSDLCGATGAVTVTFIATDDCGNTSTSSATFTVEDHTAPSITSASGMTVECGASNGTDLSAWLSNHGGATATDGCGGVTWSTNPASAILSDLCGATGAVTVTFIATDNCGNSSTSSATFTVEDHTAPSITAAINQTVECDGAGNSAALTAWLSNHGGATATDGCGGVTWSTSPASPVLSDLCGATGAVTVTFIATDDCGNSSTSSATFTVGDHTVPSITAGATSQTVECDGAGNSAALTAWLSNHGGATATDGCGGVTWSTNPASPILSDLCGATGAVTVTFIATDDCGNARMTTATFTITDTQAPSITTTATNLTVECDGANNSVQFGAWVNNHGGAIATDGCGGVSWSWAIDVPSTVSQCSGSTGSVTIIFTATDDCGNAAQTTGVFTIQDTQVPVFAGVPMNTTVDFASIPPAANVTATDNCSTPTVTLSEGYAGAPCASVFTITRTWTATDNCNNTASTAQVVTINFTLTPGSISGAQTLCADEDPMGIASVAPGAGYDMITYRWEMSYNGGAWSTIGGANAVTYDPGILAPAGTYAFRRFLVSSGTYNSSAYSCESVASNVIEVISLPLTPISAVLQVNANTVCPGEPVIFTAVPTNTGTMPTYVWKKNGNVISGASGDQLVLIATANLTSTNIQVANGDMIVVEVHPDPTVVCPRPLIAVSNTQTITVNTVTAATITIAAVENPVCPGSPATFNATVANGGVNPFFYWYVDGNLVASGTNMSSYTTGSLNAPISVHAVITVYAINCPTTATSNSNTVAVTLKPQTVPAVAITADPSGPVCGGTPITFTSAPTNGGVAPTYQWKVNGMNVGTGGNSYNTNTLVNGDIVTVVLTPSSEVCPNPATATSNAITAQITSPAPIAGCENITVSLDGTGMATIAALDIENGSTTSCGTITLISINKDHFNCSNLGANTVTLTVTNSYGYTATCTATVNVQDVTPPIAHCQTNVTVSLNAMGNATLAAAAVNNGSTDNCSITSLALSQTAYTCADVIPANAGPTNPIVVTLTVTDDAGLTASCTAEVTVIDQIAPTVVCPANITANVDPQLGCGNLVTWTEPTGVDNCGTPTLASSEVNGGFFAVGTTLVSYTATDASGNQGSCTFTVTVIDNVAPVIVGCAPTVTITPNLTTCSAIVSWSTVTATDNCPAVTLLATADGNSFAPGGTLSVGTHTILYTATDASSNTATCSFEVIVLDQVPPTASCVPNLTVALDNDGLASITTGQVNNGSSDNCGPVTLALNDASFSCVDLGSVPVTLTVTDGASNSSTCTSTVMVVDNQAPTAVCHPNITVNLGSTGTHTVTVGEVDANSSDNCTPSMTLLNNVVDCDDIGTPVVVTLVVTDASNNVATCTTSVTAQDITPPVSTECGNTITLVCPAGGTVTLDTAMLHITDNCTPTADVYVEFFDITTFDEGYIGSTIYIPFIMIDAYGNVDFCDIMVEIVAPIVNKVSKLLPITITPTPSVDTRATEELKGSIQVNPNPMLDRAMVTYTVPTAGKVRITVFDDNGRMVEKLFEGNQDAGDYSIEWNNTAQSAGTHYVVLSVDGKQVAFKPVIRSRR